MVIKKYLSNLKHKQDDDDDDVEGDSDGGDDYADHDDDETETDILFPVVQKSVVGEKNASEVGKIMKQFYFWNSLTSVRVFRRIVSDNLLMYTLSYLLPQMEI